MIIKIYTQSIINFISLILKNKYFLVSVLNSSVKILFLPILLFYLTIDDIGKYDYYIALFSVLELIFFLKISSAIYRFNLKKNKKSFVCILKYIYLIAIVALPIIIYLIEKKLVETVFLVILLFLICTFNIINELIRNNVNQKKFFVKFNSLNGILVVICPPLIFMSNGNNFISLLVGVSLSYLIPIMMFFLKKINLTSNADESRLDKRCILFFMLPIALSGLLYLLSKQSIKFFINYNYGFEENGYFYILNYFPNIIFLVSNIVILNLQDIFIHKNNDNSLFKKIHLWYMLSILILSLILFPFALLFTEYHLNKSFDYVSRIILLLGATLFYAGFSFGGVILLKERNSFQIMLGSLLNLIIFVLSLLIIGDKYGVLGIYISYFFASLFAYIQRNIFVLKIRYKYL